MKLIPVKDTPSFVIGKLQSVFDDVDQSIKRIHLLFDVDELNEKQELVKIPHLLVFDKGGTVIFSKVEKSFVEEIDKLLKEMKK